MFDTWTVDQLESTLVEAEQRIGRLRALQMALLDQLDVAQVARLDGSRNLPEWVAARCDTDVESARRLVRTTRTTFDTPELRVPLAEGTQSFARCEVTARLAATGAPTETLRASAGFDIAGARRLAARHRSLTRIDEREAFHRRHLVMQASLDQAMGRLYGEFTGYDWRVIEKAIEDRADSFPKTGQADQATATQLRADALAAICHDSLDPTTTNDGEREPSRAPLVSVIVDTRTRSHDPDLVDATVLNGPRIGVTTIERILCEGSVEAIGVDEDGTPRTLGTTSRVIPPKLRRYVLHRDGGCTIDGCVSRYRLQPHHIIPASQGGTTDPDNLTTLCWFHHHVAIHGRGYRLDPESPPQRRRLLPPTNRAPPPG